MSAEFERDLASLAVRKVLNTKGLYIGVSGAIPTAESLVLCGADNRKHQISRDIFGSKHRLSKSKFDPVKQKDFMALNIINAIKAQALFEQNKDHYSLTDQATRQLRWSFNQCNYEQRKCKDDTPIWKGNQHCIDKLDICKDEARAVKKVTLAELDKKISPLYSMVSTNPLLFNNADQGNWAAAFKSNKLTPSPLMAMILKVIPNKTSEAMAVAVKNKFNL